MPRISVVIPAYRVALYIEQCVRSVLAQTYPDFECIVVDDGSPDETASIVSAIQDPRLKLIRQENAGVASARNAGCRGASGDAVMFLDGDDVLTPNALARLISSLDAHPQAVLVFGTTLRTNAAGELEPNQKALALHTYASGEVLEEVVASRRIFFSGGQMLIRKSAIAEAGGYDPDLPFAEDWEFFCRLAALGPCLYIGPQEEIMRHRVRPDSAAPTLSAKWQNYVPAVRKVMKNRMMEQRFGADRWRALIKEAEATHLFEAGRQSFIKREFGLARRLMIKSLLLAPSTRRLILFAAAQVTQVFGRPVLARLRFTVAA
ncbi:MAG: glycosyltransferase family 2 protein [Caulobacteraceae bacterium]